MAEAESEQRETERRRTGPAGPGRRRLAVRWVVAAVTFVVGLFVGGIAVGLLSEGAPKLPRGAGAASVPSPAPAPSSGPTAAAGAVVNDACLRALHAAQDMYSAVQDVGRAAGRFDVRGLDQAIRRLQPLEGQLRQDVDACRVTAELPAGSTGTAPSTATPSATTATPTR